jgi:hypothetical protein
VPLPAEPAEPDGARRLAAQEREERERARLFRRTVVWCVAWELLGMWGVAWSLHTTSPFYGRIAFWAGLGIGNGGALLTLVRAGRTAARRGWR